MDNLCFISELLKLDLNMGVAGEMDAIVTDTESFWVWNDTFFPSMFTRPQMDISSHPHLPEK